MPSLTCPGCGQENRVGARFCENCGSSLAPRCASCGAEVSSTARFCSSCGAPTGIEPVAVGALKVVSVVFSDLVGSTALQEALDPESARHVMARFYEEMRAVVDAHRGKIEKFIGDAVVAVFGVPTVSEDDALRAVRCAAAMAARLEQLGDELERVWGVRLQMRTGVNTGELVISDQGILVGDTMNTAARLEQAAAAEEVLISESTWRLIRHEVELEEIVPLELKGKSQPVRAWRVVSAAHQGNAPSRARIDAPLVGREHELARLHAALKDAVDARDCRLITVIGSPGLGKSRLAAEFSRVASGLATVVEGHCEPSGEGITFLPVAEVLRAAASIGETDPPEQVLSKLTTIAGDGPDRQRVAQRTAALLGVGAPAAPEETFWGVRSVLESLARSRPLVIVLDDVHWGQPMFLDLIEHLIEWVRDAPILLVALARPELRDTREALAAAGRRATDVIELEPLQPRESRALLGGLLGEADLPDELLKRILETTEGNPLFLSELLRMLIEDGSLERHGDVWVAAGGADAVQVPPTIQALLTARIERLRADERSVVERAAVIGKQFYRGAVAELVAPPVRSGIDGHLETLRRKDMVEPEGIYWIDEPVYRFHHVLIRDAAYHLLLKEARAELHERFAEWLQTKAGELVGEHEEVIAYHLEQAHEYRKALGPLDQRGKALGARAADRLASAGRRALAREDLAAAANLLQRALDRGAADHVAWDLSEALLSAGDTGAASAAVKRLSGPRADVLEAQLAVLTGSDPLEQTLERVSAATAALAAAGDAAAEAKGYHVTAAVQAQLGRVGDVETSLDKALLAARKVQDRRRITAVLAAAPRAALWGPSPVVRASGRCLDVVRILRMTPGNRHVEAVALRCQAVLEAMRGRFDAAREILAGGRTTLEELGLRLELQELAMHRGIVELIAGRAQDAEGLLRSARDGFAQLGVSVSAAQAAALLARALVEQGRDEEAIVQTEYAEKLAGGDLKTTITWLGARAEALARRGERERALEYAGRAVSLAEPTDALADKADANMALARVLRDVDQAGAARRAAEVARELYQRKDYAVGVQRATELASLAAVPEPVQTARATAAIEDPALAAHWARFVACWEQRDAEALASLYAEDYVNIDHRELGWGERTGHEANLQWARSALGISPDVRVRLDKVIAAAPGVFAVIATWYGHSAETGGEGEISMGRVTTIRDAKITRVEIFDPDAESSIRACFEDLRGRMLLGDRPPERVYKRFADAFARRDRETLARAWVDTEFVDHRPIGWGELQGQKTLMEIAESVFTIAPDVRWVVDEVLACDACVIALRVRYMGSVLDGGGPVELAVGSVNVVENDVVVRAERFDYDDRAGMLARYRELGGTLDLLGHKPPERLWAEFKRLFDAHDVDGLLELYAEDWCFIDHRKLGMQLGTGPEGAAALFRSAFDGSADVRVDVEQVIACDERVIALAGAYRGTSSTEGAEFEIPFAVVTVIEDCLLHRTEAFEPEDRAAIIARYHELARATASLERPAEHVIAEAQAAQNARDYERLARLMTEDFYMLDHRALGWPAARGRQQGIADIRSAFDAAPTLRLDYDEVLAADDSVIVTLNAWRGSGLKAGEHEVRAGAVHLTRDGRWAGVDFYEADDRLGMLARFNELTGTATAALGDRPPERVWAQYIGSFNASDFRALEHVLAPDYEFVDHRTLGYEPAIGIEGGVAMLRSARKASADLRIEATEVLACDEQAIALLVAWRGHGVKAGELELPMGVVAVIEHGRLKRHELFNPDDREAILTRYAELGGARSPLGDRRSERVLTEVQQALHARDYDRLATLLAEDCYIVDHRALGYDDAHGRAECLRDMRAAFDASPNIRVEFDEVLAADDGVVVVEVAFRGRGVKAGELETGYVAVVLVQADQFAGVDYYETHDLTAAIARYAELGGGLGKLGDSPAERAYAEFCRRYARRDLESALELISDELVRTDHRALAWAPARGRDADADLILSAWKGSTDLRAEIDEVLAADQGLVALRTRWVGHDLRGGAFELALGQVVVVGNGQLLSIDQYDPEDREAMMARFEELRGRVSE
jgi:class 3 adenylate cyclase/ketosteroid isomerase-like protein